VAHGSDGQAGDAGEAAYGEQLHISSVEPDVTKESRAGWPRKRETCRYKTPV
jgi:hypothetical protein